MLDTLTDNGSSAIVPKHFAYEQRHALGQMFSLLAEGERVAARVAQLQAAESADGDTRAARFYRSQVRQESMHALVFDWSRRLVTHKLLAGAPFVTPDVRTAFAPFTQAALDPSLTLLHRTIATQCVLEGFGEAILTHLDDGLTKYGVGLSRLRHRILAQEASHHAFGQETIANALRAGHISRPQLAVEIDRFESLVVRAVNCADDAQRVFGLSTAKILAKARALT